MKLVDKAFIGKGEVIFHMCFNTESKILYAGGRRAIYFSSLAKELDFVQIHSNIEMVNYLTLSESKNILFTSSRDGVN